MIENLVDAWNLPATRHAMLVHFPVVLSILAVPVAAIAALIRRDRNAMQWTAVALFALLAITSATAKLSGEDAEEAVEGSLAGPAEEVLERHETLAEWVWIFAAGVTALTGASLIWRSRPRLVFGWLAVAGGLFIAGWVANTADHGGRLVYRHGAGTAAAAVVVPAAGPAPAEAPVLDRRVVAFREHVRPILVENCLRCHNPQRARRSGDLVLTSIAGALDGGMSGPVIVPGHPDESLLITAVRRTDPDLQMPKGRPKLPDDQVEALERWIADGAVWDAFEYTAPAAAPEREGEPDRPHEPEEGDGR